jgi:N-methylhydantoinase A
MSRYSVAVDVGGTFTDVTLADLDTGRIWNSKTPTTPSDPSIGFLTGVDRVLALAGASPDDVVRVLHGTTIATNAILESKGAKSGLVTTQGFKYVLEIGRHDAPRWVNILTWQKPKRPVLPENVREVSERIDADGGELKPLNEDDCRAAARHFKINGIDSIAICFLHSYANPTHEVRAREIMATEHPTAWFSISSEVLPVFREYERSMATVLNSYVMPTVSQYIGRLQKGLEGREVGKAAGVNRLISIDVGGTSADLCLIRDHGADITTEGRVGAWPFATPMIDIHTVGAGGGSVASVTTSGNLVVGPASAGADPGPACYGRGGELPCVTDANLVLGRLPIGLAGGGLELDVAASRLAIERHVADRLGIDVVTAAAGIIEIINNSMMGAIRVITVERGIDPREFTLLPFGGAGPLHAASLARLLDIPSVLISRSPGVLSALGLLVSDVRNDFARSCHIRNPKSEDVAQILIELEKQAHDWLAIEGVPGESQLVNLQADLRYPSQVFELTVNFPRDSSGSPDLKGLYESFHAEHERLYGYGLRDSTVELVTVRASAIGMLAGNDLPIEGDLPVSTSTAAPAPITSQPIYFNEIGDFTDCPVYDRLSLTPGVRFTGPALVVQMDTTTLILPDQPAWVDRGGNLILTNTSSNIEGAA